jgi:HK97 gp10 family phage protein
VSVRLTASVGNLAKVAATLLEADAVAQRRIRQTVATYNTKHWRLARDLCPVSKVERRVGDHEHKPGFLRSQIRQMISDNGLVGRVGWRDKDFRERGEPPYFRYTERGTRRMKARPCVTPARDAIKPEFVSALGANIRGGLRRMRKSA